MTNQRFIVCSDLHGDMQDKGSVNALLKFCDLWKPSIRIFAGDLWDFRPLRRGACDDEKRESMRADYKAGMKFLGDFRPQHFLRGNHDERLWQWRDKDNGVASDYAGELVESCEKELVHLKCSMLPYDKRKGILRVKNSHLKVLHGFHCSIYAARQTALIYNSVLFGHTHAITEHAIAGLERRAARNIGCLCDLDMDYAAKTPSTLAQAHGFAYGVLLPRGEYIVWQAEKMGGKWIVADGVAAL